MTHAVDQLVVCPVVVGREEALQTLSAVLDMDRESDSPVVLISGEAGIGKSRLVSHLLARVVASRFPNVRVLRGYCFEPDRSLPYAPVLDLLRREVAASGREELVARAGAFAPALARLRPELADHNAELARQIPLDPASEKHQIFTALVTLFQRLAEDAPVLVVVEDIHWCDDIGLELLLYLAHQLCAQLCAHPCRLLMTYRSDEVHPSLRHLLAMLDRDRLAHEIALNPLSLAEVDMMVRAIFTLNRSVRPDFLATLYELTEGNPFFVEETLKALVTSGDIYYRDGIWDRKDIADLRIPRSVHDAVQRRLAGLSAEAREVLSVAAVIGQVFDFALVQELTGHDEPTLLGLLRELIGAQLLVEVSAERFGFRHALTRQAVYRELLARERRRLHRAVADALVRLYPSSLDAYVADLAAHYHAAETWDESLDYARRAGERSMALYSPRAAVTQFTRALEASHRLALVTDPALSLSRGRACEMLGDFAAAQSDYETALTTAQQAGDQGHECEALLALGQLWAGRDYAVTGGYFQQALDCSERLGDETLRARCLNRVGNWHLNLDRPALALEHHQRALEIFERRGDEYGVAETLDLLGMASLLHLETGRGAVALRRAVSLGRRLGLRQTVSSSLATLSLCGVVVQTIICALDPVEARMGAVSARESANSAQAIGWRAGEAFGLEMLGSCLVARGEYREALDAARRGVAIADEIAHQQWMTCGRWLLGFIYYELMDYVQAREHLERGLRMAREIGSRHWIGCTAGFLALACAALGDFSRADAACAEALPNGLALHSMGQRQAVYGHAVAQLARGRADAALRALDALLGAASTGAPAEAPRPPYVLHARARALVLKGTLAEAERDLMEALDGARTLGAHAEIWRIHVTLGELYRRQRRPADAARAFSDARQALEGRVPYLPEGPLGVAFLRAAVAQLPAPARRASGAHHSGLTPREREVARLVAAGRSNREIAGDLIVSERTVESHISNAFLKLGISSRAQLAAWAVEKGLVGETARD